MSATPLFSIANLALENIAVADIDPANFKNKKQCNNRPSSYFFSIHHLAPFKSNDNECVIQPFWGSQWLNNPFMCNHTILVLFLAAIDNFNFPYTFTFWFET